MDEQVSHNAGIGGIGVLTTAIAKYAKLSPPFI
jgi:hypothetical protein